MRTPLLLYALAFVVRGALMVLFPDPAYPDSSYYVDVARALAAGHGLNVDFVWIFAEVGGKLPDPAVLPIPSNAHWLPLASFIQAPFVWVLGPTAIASALPMVLIGSLAAPLTWFIARDVGASRTVQLGAGVLSALPAAGLVFMAQPENFAIFQPLVAATLWLAARGLRGSTRSYVLSGLLVGLASIARNDAFLLGAAVGLVWVIDRARAWRGHRPPNLPFVAALGCLGLFLLIAGPWWARQLVTFGSISPTASGGSALWLTAYRQWNSITADVSLQAFLAQGIGSIVASRVLGFVAAAANFAVIIGSVVLVPLIVVGGWVRRRSDDFLPWFLYAGILFLGATLIFPLHVPGGAFIHSAVGLGPHAYILALEAVAVGVGWIAKRRPAWDPKTAVPLFSWAVVVFVVASGLLYAPIVHAVWDQDRQARQALAAELVRLGVPADDRLFTIDAGGYKYYTGHPGVVTPDDPMDTLHAVAAAYGLRWLILERGAVVEAFEPVLTDDVRPAWIGPAAFVIPAPTGGPPTLALYPVCVSDAPGSAMRDAMTRREAWLSAGGIFLVALVLRAIFAAQIVFPKPEDTAYYVGVARNLLEGRGLVSDALWSYGTPPLVFPRPAFEVWLPLPTWLAALPMALLGVSFAAAQVSSVLIGALVPVLAWRLAADVATERGLSTERARTLALGTGLTCAVYLPLMLHSALPDSTMPFAALALAACLLMTRLARDPRGARLTDWRLLALGALIGLTALTRNEAVWLAFAWFLLVVLTPSLSWPIRARLIGVAAVVAALVFAPWAVRDWQVFGSPLPGQAVTNAFSVTGFDIFAWNDPPTLARYLAAGPQRLLEMRVDGLTHNLFSVLLLPGIPIALVGLLALPWQGRAQALRPVLILSITTFLVTSLVFPVATTWGTFLHASGPVHVLLVISALLALDASIARLGTRLGWTRPVAWLGAALGIFSAALFTAVLLPTFGTGSRETAGLYDELAVRMAAAGHPLDGSAGPVISNFPIWMAESQRVSALALPDESPADVVDLAHHFPGTRLLVLVSPESRHWPADLASGAAGAECFHQIDLGPGPAGVPDPLAETTAFEIVCP